jgi:hypothetical protein
LRDGRSSRLEPESVERRSVNQQWQSRKDGPVADDKELDSHLVAVFDELIELVQEIKQVEWSAPSADRRRALEQLKELLGQRAVDVSDAEQRSGGASPSIVSPSAHRPRNLSAEAGGDTTRLLQLLVTDLAAVAEDVRGRSTTSAGEWQHTFHELADGLEDHIASLREM